MKLKNQQISIKCCNRNVCVKAYKKNTYISQLHISQLQGYNIYTY